MLTLSKTTESDLPQLRDLSISSFADDEKYKPVGAISGGPPGHDSLQKHGIWLSSMNYYKCTKAGELVGSCILDIHGNLGVVHGIHVKQEFMGKGIGSWILSEVQRVYPRLCVWELETPDYAIRNHRFYEKNGFSLVEITPKESAIGFGFYKYRKGQQVNRLDR